MTAAVAVLLVNTHSSQFGGKRRPKKATGYLMDAVLNETTCLLWLHIREAFTFK